MEKELVISAYERDYDWIKEISDAKITIYRKGNIDLKSGEILMEPNVGRDVHTFIKHIANNYYNLSEITFFSQDYPFDHVKNYVDIINGRFDDWNREAKQHVDGCWFFCTQYDILTCDTNGCPNHCGLDMKKAWHFLFGERDCPETFRFTPTGHFAISASHARKIPLEFYLRLIELLETDEHSPWVIERLEPYIFL
jgi:hypothetical protein